MSKDTDNDEWLETPVATAHEWSDPCKQFFCDYLGYMSFVDTIFNTAKAADTSTHTLLGVMRKIVPAAAAAGTSAPTEASDTYTSLLKIYSTLLAQMVWCRGVDNFLTYVAQLLGLIFRTRPETLKSSKQESLEIILGFSSIDELVAYLAEKRVYDLAFRGMRELQGTLLRELGFDLFPVQERLNRAVLIIEDRNLIVHNRCVINETYIRRTQADLATVGAMNIPGLLCAQRCMRFLAHAAVDIDGRAVAKFKLPGKPVSEECAGCVRKANDGIRSLSPGTGANASCEFRGQDT